uniref:Uncharacterized protein n=1 Tax=Anguilla anguilla TaxID=7936 RepID=A0A0E9QQT5_ANGAN
MGNKCETRGYGRLNGNFWNKGLSFL